jgi:hypothetical protein
MYRLPIVVFLLILSGCHTQAPRVRCDSKLQPINVSSPIVKEPAGGSASTP